MHLDLDSFAVVLFVTEYLINPLEVKDLQTL